VLLFDSNLVLFLEISLFFLGVAFLCAYGLHRVVFIMHSKSLSRHFPSAFNACFKLIIDFFEIIVQSKDFEANRFLSQITSRHDFHIPAQFHDLPQKVALSAYQQLKKLQNEFKADPLKTTELIRTSVYNEYYQTYRFQVLHESFTWLLIFIPFAFTSAILLPLSIYFYFPLILRDWPLGATVGGVALAILIVIKTIKEYSQKR
jgi:hypothetical protein